MSTDNSDFSEVEISDNLQRIVERMARAKWITGWARVTPDEATLQLTDLGRRQIAKLAKHVRPVEDRFLCGGPRRVSALTYLRLRIALLVHARQLHGLWMSVAQYHLLVSLVASEALKLRLNEAPKQIERPRRPGPSGRR